MTGTATTRRRAAVTAAAAAGTGLLLAACSSGSARPAGSPPSAGSSTASPAVPSAGAPGAPATAAAGTTQQVTVHTTDQLRFVPDTIKVHRGTVRLTIVDDGSYPHNLSIPQLHATSADVTGDPGSTSTTLTLHLSQAGTYGFVCTYHASAGMRGELVVS